MNLIKISVIIPVFNQESILSKTLDSVLFQNFKNWECIIVDDGSTDGSRKIIQKYVLQDRRFKYFYQNNKGPSAARNFGINKSKGEYILPLDSDDEISPYYLKEAVDFLDNNKTTKIVYCKAEFIGNKTGEFVLPEYSYRRMLIENIFFVSAVFRRADFLKINGYDEFLKEGLEDWDFWLSFIKRTDIVYKIPKKYFFYRISKKSRNSNINSKIFKLINLRFKIYLKHRHLYDLSTSVCFFIKSVCLFMYLIKLKLKENFGYIEILF